jgi:hypothetical protein
MKLVLESFPYKAAQNLQDVGVSVNGNSYPTYSEQVVDGRFVYTKTYLPEYIANGIEYTVSGYSGSQIEVQTFNNLKSSYNPIELQVAYLSGDIYSNLDNYDISFFKYWYNQATVYSQKSVYKELSSLALYKPFSNSVGSIMLFTPTSESIQPTQLKTANVKVYDRVIESNILDDIRSEIDQAVKDANSSYSDNIANVASNSSSTTPHGGKLVVDANSNTRYQSASANYLNNLVGAYAQLMYWSPLYAYSTQNVELSTAPFFSANVEGTSVVVDNLNRKVSTQTPWMETVMLSAYPEK